MKKIIIALSSLILLASCGPTTKIQKSWKDPESNNLSLANANKVLVAALLNDESSRRSAEDQLVAKLQGKGVPSYSLFPNGTAVNDEEVVRSITEKNGIESALVLRLLDVDKDMQYVPGTYSSFPSYYRGFYGYYYRSYNTFYEPGYYQNTKTYIVETNVYDLKNNKLLYSAVTSTTDPTKLSKMLDEIVEAVGHQMRKEGFIK